MPTPGDIRAQYVLQVRAEGQGELDKINKEIARLRDESDKVREAFRQAEIGGKQYKAGLAAIEPTIGFLAKKHDELIISLDSLEASAKRVAAAVGEAAQKEADDFARLATRHEQLMAKMEADAERAAIAEAEAFAKLANRHADAMEKMERDAQAEATAEAEAMAKVAARHADLMDKMDADAARAATAEADEFNRLAQRHADAMEKMERDAQAEATAEAEAMAKVAARHADLMDKMDADAARAATAEADEFNRLAQRHADAMEKMERDAHKEAMAEADEMIRLAIAHQAMLDKHDAAEAAQAAKDAALAKRATDAQVKAWAEEMDFHERIAREDEAIEKEKWANIVSTVFASTAQISKIDAASRRAGDGLDQARSGAQYTSYAFLNLAHALQDAQYGFGAVLNNIPLVVQGMGGSAGLAGTIMIAGVAFEVLKGHVGDFRTLLGMTIDPATKFGNSVTDVKARLEALTAKSWKFDVDYQGIKQAEEQLRKLEAAKRAFDEANKDPREAIKKQAMEASADIGGPGRLAQIYASSLTEKGLDLADQSDLDTAKHLKEYTIPKLAERVNKAGSRATKFLWEKALERYTSQLADVENKIEKDRTDRATTFAGDFFAGNETAIQMTKALVRQKPGAFNQAAQQRIMDLPENPAQAKARTKMIEEINRQNEQEAHEIEVGGQEAVTDIGKHVAALSTNKSLGGLLGDEGRKLVARGVTDPKELVKRLTGLAEERIRESKLVPGDILAPVAQKVLEAAVRKMIDELIAQDLDIQKAAKAGAAAGEAKAEKPEIKRQAGLLGPQMKDDMDEAFLRKMAEGQQGEGIWRSLTPQVKTRAKRFGTAGDIIDDVTKKVIRDAEDRVVAELVGRFGAATPQTAAALLGERQAGWLGKGRGLENRQQAMQSEGLAQDIFANSRQMTGRQFTPDQSRQAAKKAVDMMEEGADAMAATLTAMREVIASMGQLQMRLNGMKGQANALGKRARQQFMQRPMPGRMIGG